MILENKTFLSSNLTTTNQEAVAKNEIQFKPLQYMAVTTHIAMTLNGNGQYLVNTKIG